MRDFEPTKADVYVGFDSAWTDNQKAPGAICAVTGVKGALSLLRTPHLVSFDQALSFVRKVQSSDGMTLVAIDQSTIVPNLTGMRPVERVAASLISWIGGGVQPSNRGRLGMFCKDAPIWRFLAALGAKEDPEDAATASAGLYILEVFPALALPSIDTRFFGRLKAPKYNPDRRQTFRLDDWKTVTEVVSKDARELGCDELADWCLASGSIPKPSKGDQDKLDSVICVLVALRWRLLPRSSSMLLGDLDRGYMVAPASVEVRNRLYFAACRNLVALDGFVPSDSQGGDLG